MTDLNTELEQEIEPRPAAILPAPALLRSVGAAAPQAAAVRASSKPKRASKGQRKHIRRLKQAGEFKTSR